MEIHVWQPKNPIKIILYDLPYTCIDHEPGHSL